MDREGIDGFFLNCQLDEKFELIEAEFGLKGFAILIKLFQRIYGEHGYYCEYNSDISLLLAAKWRVTSFSGDADNSTNRRQFDMAETSSVFDCHNLIDQVVTASIRRGIFDKSMFEKYGILTSYGIQKRYRTATRKRTSVDWKNEYLLLSDGKNRKMDGQNGKMDGQNGKMDAVFQQSKEKKSKVYNTPLTPLQRFEDFCQSYPLEINRTACQSLTIAYCKEVQNGMSEDILVEAATNYAEACRIVETKVQFIKHPENFLKDGFYLRYTGENYIRPQKVKEKKGSFNQFAQNDYDFDALEKELLSN